MVDVVKLKGEIVGHGKRTQDVADLLGISLKSWYDRIKKRNFDADEMYKIKAFLDLSDQQALEIFFANEVT